MRAVTPQLSPRGRIKMWLHAGQQAAGRSPQLDGVCHTPTTSPRKDQDVVTRRSAGCGALSAIGWGLSHHNYLSVEGWLHAGQQVWDALHSWKESCYTLTI